MRESPRLAALDRAEAPKAPGKARAFLPPWLRHALRTVLHIALDGAAVAGAYALAYELRFRSGLWTNFRFLRGADPGWGLYSHLLYAIIPLWIFFFWYSSGLYHNPWRNLFDRFLALAKGCALASGAVLLAAYIYNRLEYSRLMLLLAFPIGLVAATAAEILTACLDSGLAKIEAARPILMLGSGSLPAILKRRIWSRHPAAEITEIKELPGKDDLEREIRKKPYLEMILLRGSFPHEKIIEAAEICEEAGVTFKLLPDLLELRLGEIQMDQSLGLPAYRLGHSSLSAGSFIAKRAFDVLFGAAVIVLGLIPLAAVAALIKLDSPGPVFYRQKRYGLRGRVFEALKFRTMIANAESKIEEVKSLGENQSFFKAKADPRVTRVGKILRRLSLDEFPQFWNALKGEMSVVGPRPLAVTTGELERLKEDFGPAYKKRLNIVPGITGLWQVSGRSELSSEQRFALDLFYIEHWSLGLDLEIILKTVPAVLFGKGAY